MLTLRDAEIEMPAEFVGKGADPNTLGPKGNPFWQAGFPLRLKTFVTSHPFATAVMVLAASLGAYSLVKKHKR